MAPLAGQVGGSRPNRQLMPLLPVLNEHASSRLIVLDTGLGITRTEKVVIISVTSRPRERDAKLKFYELVCSELLAACGIASSDIVLNIVTNADEDWSFGLGRAQFLTGEL